MNKKIIFSILTILFFTVLFLNNRKTKFEKTQIAYSEYLAKHPYSNRKSLSREALKTVPKKDRPDLAFEQDFLRTMDPKTKRLHQDRLVKAINYSEVIQSKSVNRKKKKADFNWESRGPKKVAGRVRAVMFDPNDATNKRVFSGGVSGGIWKNEDITDENSEWNLVYPEMSNFAVSAIDYDPVQTTTFYLGSGEGWMGENAVNGAGIWKTTDAGVTWNNLASTTNFEFVYDLIVRDEGGTIGVIYAAMEDIDGISSNEAGLFRSTDGGVTWTIVSSEKMRDLELASNNTIWAGNANGGIFSSSNGTTWTSKYTSSLTSLGRVELATAKSNTNFVYALITSNNKLGEVVKTTNAGSTWSQITEPSDTGDATVPNDDFTRGQAWYDLIINISPTNENEVYAGGINTFKSTDGGATWIKISTWESFYDDSVSFVHTDIHNIIFRPGFNELLFATDGGIFYSPDNSIIATKGSIFPRNLNFNITQFYAAAIDPVNQNAFIGGSQDNGTNYLFEPGLSNSTALLGGDGGFSFIDQTATNATESIYYIAATQQNVAYLYDSSDPSVDYITLVNDIEAGSFINAAAYDSENNTYYSFNSNNEISKVTLKADFVYQGNRDAFEGTKEVITLPLIAKREVTNITVSPYNTANRKVFLGTDIGTLLVLNANDDTTIVMNSPNVTGAISSIEIGASDDEILLIYSNYGVKSVWSTIDGGSNWADVEGNLPDIPVRWSLFNPLDRKEVLLATESGIWKTNDITATSVVWEPASSGMGSVRVDMLQYRASDNLVLAATHGRGMFTSNFTDGTASVDDVLLEIKPFTVYPTISKGNFTVFAKSTLGKVKISVFDISGRQVYASELDFNQNEKQVVSIDVNSGIYVVNLIDKEGKKSSTKIVVE